MIINELGLFLAMSCFTVIGFILGSVYASANKGDRLQSGGVAHNKSTIDTAAIIKEDLCKYDQASKILKRTIESNIELMLRVQLDRYFSERFVGQLSDRIERLITLLEANTPKGKP